MFENLKLDKKHKTSLKEHVYMTINRWEKKEAKGMQTFALNSTVCYRT